MKMWHVLNLNYIFGKSIFGGDFFDSLNFNRGIYQYEDLAIYVFIKNRQRIQYFKNI